MASDQIALWLGGIFAAVLALWLAWKVLKLTVIGALLFLNGAAAQGFLGFAAYVAMWVLLFPVMALLSFGLGAVAAWKDKEPEPDTAGWVEWSKAERAAERRVQEILSEPEPDVEPTPELDPAGGASRYVR